MINKLLPSDILSRIGEQFKDEQICEIRLRENLPIYVGTLSGYKLLEGGNCLKSHIEHIVAIASNNSIYTVNESLKQGYLIYEGGVRIGVCGEVVEENGCVITMKNITSLVVRIAKEAVGFALKSMEYLIDTYSQNIFSTLVLSPPGSGKTTFLRDLSVQICDCFTYKNICIIDDRGEITGRYGRGILYAGNSVDVLYCKSKAYSLSVAVKNLRPDVIMCDELISEQDILGVQYALTMGVKIVATMHAKDIEELGRKSYFHDILNRKFFERYVILNNFEVKHIYDGEKNILL